MNHRTRILADRLIGTPLAFLANGAARVLGAALRRDHSVSPQNVKVIIVGKLLGMGSILQASPLLRALKNHFPDAKLIFVTLESNRALLSRLTCVDQILTLDDSNVFVMAISTLRLIFAMVRLRGDLYFDLEVYSAFASLLALMAVTRNRLGFYRYSASFKKGIYTHLVYFNTRMPIRQLYLQLGRVAGVPAGGSESTSPIRIDDADRKRLSHVLSQSPDWQLSSPYLVVNPNASDLLLERRWPTCHAVSAISGLVSRGHQIALIGAPSERAFVTNLRDLLSPHVQRKVYNTAGLLSLGELLALLDGASCVLTNDTGPMHMAIALNRPTVCLFGPVSPDHYGQPLGHVEIIYSQVFCSPCLHEVDAPPCNGNNICMQRIDPEVVIEAVDRLARQSAEPALSRKSAGPRLPIVTDAPDGAPLGVIVRASLQ